MLLPAGLEVCDFGNPATKMKMKISNKSDVLTFPPQTQFRVILIKIQRKLRARWFSVICGSSTSCNTKFAGQLSITIRRNLRGQILTDSRLCVKVSLLKKISQGFEVLKTLFCTRLYGSVPSSISSESVRSYNRSQLKSVRKQVTTYIIRYWNGKQFSAYNLFFINPWNPLIRTCTSATEPATKCVRYKWKLFI